MKKIETINLDILEGFLTTYKELPKKAVLTKYVIENETLNTYAVYTYYCKKGSKTYLIKTL